MALARPSSKLGKKTSLGSVWHNGEDMTKIEGKTPKKYGRNLARKYFTEEEMLSQRSNPRKSNSLPSLNAEVLENIRDWLRVVFQVSGQMHMKLSTIWVAIYRKRRSVSNQKQEVNKVNGAEGKNDNNRKTTRIGLVLLRNNIRKLICFTIIEYLQLIYLIA